MHECENLPLRAAADVQISSLQSTLGERSVGGGGVKAGGRGGDKSYVAQLC